MSLLGSTPRIVGVDVGSKRVGIARSDPLRMFAQVYGTFAPDEALDELGRLADGDGIAEIVVGWPLTLEGTEDEATERVDAYVEQMREAVPGVEIARRDERFTSEMAKDALREAGVRQPGRFDKGRVDAAAAAIILQDYLDEG